MDAIDPAVFAAVERAVDDILCGYLYALRGRKDNTLIEGRSEPLVSVGMLIERRLTQVWKRQEKILSRLPKHNEQKG